MDSKRWHKFAVVGVICLHGAVGMSAAKASDWLKIPITLVVQDLQYGAFNGSQWQVHICLFEVTLPLLLHSNDVRWVLEILQPHEVLLDASGGHKAIEYVNAPCFIVCPACACAAERLLSNNSTCALLVVVHIAGRIAQLVRGSEECLSVSREATTKLSIDSRVHQG